MEVEISGFSCLLLVCIRKYLAKIFLGKTTDYFPVWITETTHIVLTNKLFVKTFILKSFLIFFYCCKQSFKGFLPPSTHPTILSRTCFPLMQFFTLTFLLSEWSANYCLHLFRQKVVIIYKLWKNFELQKFGTSSLNNFK